MQTKFRSTKETTGQAPKIVIFSYYTNTKMLGSLYLVSHITEFETKWSTLIGVDPTYIPDAKDASPILVILC